MLSEDPRQKPTSPPNEGVVHVERRNHPNCHYWSDKLCWIWHKKEWHAAVVYKHNGVEVIVVCMENIGTNMYGGFGLFVGEWSDTIRVRHDLDDEVTGFVVQTDNGNYLNHHGFIWVSPAIREREPWVFSPADVEQIREKSVDWPKKPTKFYLARYNRKAKKVNIIYGPLPLV